MVSTGDHFWIEAYHPTAQQFGKKPEIKSKELKNGDRTMATPKSLPSNNDGIMTHGLKANK
jgi:hypothetical protein